MDRRTGFACGRGRASIDLPPHAAYMIFSPVLVLRSRFFQKYLRSGCYPMLQHVEWTRLLSPRLKKLLISIHVLSP
jgi:hypothetical protein